MSGKSKPAANSKRSVEQALASATDKILAELFQLYDSGLSSGPGSLGLLQIATSPQLNMVMRKPRKRVTVMLIGNHSAGKSSFINWYAGEDIQKTGVAIETRGFTFVTNGKKRETLAGEGTLKCFPFLNDVAPGASTAFGKIGGILPNLFTEITTSKEKNMSAITLIDTPGLVDGDMQYPFDVEEAILLMADHVDMIMVLLDPIGQATCKRTMQVVEKLNLGPHLEKVHYFMSKADVVEKEHDRQRVLIQITQNLATRIRNSHAFNLPTFYLPRGDDEPPCNIPNAIEEVCKEIDKSINSTVQKNLRLLKDDCERILARCEAVAVEDREKRRSNMRSTLQGLAFTIITLALLLLLVFLAGTRMAPSFCRVADHLCQTALVRGMVQVSPAIAEHFNLLAGSVLFIALFTAVLAKVTWRLKPVFSARDVKQVELYKAQTRGILELEHTLYDKYLNTIAHEDR